MRIPVVNRPASLRIDNKPATKYHDGEIIVETRQDLQLLTDNKGAFDISHTNGPSKRTKHLDVRHHYIQQQVHTKVIRMTQVPTSEQWADFLTKAVGRVIFRRSMTNIGYPSQWSQNVFPSKHGACHHDTIQANGLFARINMSLPSCHNTTVGYSVSNRNRYGSVSQLRY